MKLRPNDPNSNAYMLSLGGAATAVDLDNWNASKFFFHDNTVVAMERKDGGYSIMATADFEPTIEKHPWVVDVRTAMLFMPIVTPGGGSDELERTYALPGWLSMAQNLDLLSIGSAILNDLEPVTKHLKVLVLYEVKIENKTKVLHDISKLTNLKYLGHDLVFPPTEIAILKERNPNLIVLLKEEFQAAWLAGRITY
jgi:hypothetical protein